MIKFVRRKNMKRAFLAGLLSVAMTVSMMAGTVSAQKLGFYSSQQRGAPDTGGRDRRI